MSLELDLALKLVKDAEGFEPHEYRCTAKKLTQGYGRNIEVPPLSDEEKEELNEDGSPKVPGHFFLVMPPQL